MIEEKSELTERYTKFPYRLRRRIINKYRPRVHLKTIKTIQKEIQKAAEMPDNLEKIQSDFDLLKDQLLRTRADFENYRKRVVRDSENVKKYAAEELVKELLVSLDNFERAIDAAKQIKDFDGLSEGVEIIHQQLLSTLTNKGLKKIDAYGKKFDPYYHEAVMVEERTDVADQTITDVISEGYMLNEKVIRPAAVKVSKAP